MKELLKKLQAEAGLTELQASKTISVIKNALESGDIDIDWGNLVKGKYDGLLSTAKNTYGDVSDEAHKFADKLSDKADDFADNAKAKLKDLSQKAVDFFDNDDDQKKA